MDPLTRMYAEAWAKLPAAVVELVVLPEPREDDDED